MRKILSIFIMSGIILSCALSAYAIDIYTFKKKRVDQELNGNRGYVMGTPPPPGERKDKRTLIGIDIELPGVVDDDYSEEEYTETASVKTETGCKPVTVVSDEEWIK